MRNRFDLQLKQLNDDIIEMGNMIERAIEMGVYALIGHDTDKAKQTIDYDMDIDHMERDIEALCMKLLLQQQPVARDLRQISSALKMITDMERIGVRPRILRSYRCSWEMYLILMKYTDSENGQ